MEFKKGDTVQLKSGGPCMTIEGFYYDQHKKIYREDKVECKWFNGKKLERDVFVIDMLKPCQVD